MAQNLVQVAALCNAHSFCLHLHATPFSSKQTFARIDFLRSGGQLVDYEGTLSVKNLAEKVTIVDE